MVTMADVARVPLGRFVRPAVETGSGRPRVEVVLGYAVRTDSGVVLLDTGIGAVDQETQDWYRPERTPLPEALRSVGVSMDEVALVVNCHLHFDHCGGNALLPGRPVVVQRTELDTARSRDDYTLPELVDFPGVSYEVADGEVEVSPGLLVVPTPGHTDGHQSLVVRCTDGTVVLAGQSHDYTSDYAADAAAVRARRDGVAPPLPASPAWMDRLLDLDPARVMFAHDLSVWLPR